MYLGDTPQQVVTSSDPLPCLNGSGPLQSGQSYCPVEFKDMTADQQAAFLATQDGTGIPYSQMTAAQQSQFLNNSDWNALTPAQQSALLNTLSVPPSWIPGISNNLVLGIAGALVLFMVMGRGR